MSLCLILLISVRTKCLSKHATLIYSFIHKTDVQKRHERTRALSSHLSSSDHKEGRSVRFCVYGNNNSTSAGLVQITIQHCSRKHSRRSASVNTEGGIEQLYGCQHKRAVKVLCAAPRWDETESFQELPQQRWEVLSRVDPVQDLPAEFTYRKSNKHQWLSPVCSLTGPYWYLV